MSQALLNECTHGCSICLASTLQFHLLYTLDSPASLSLHAKLKSDFPTLHAVCTKATSLPTSLLSVMLQQPGSRSCILLLSNMHCSRQAICISMTHRTVPTLCTAGSIEGQWQSANPLLPRGVPQHHAADSLPDVALRPGL